MQLPNSWDEITVDQFIQLKSVEETDFNSLLSFKMDALFIMTDTAIDDECWDDIDTDELQKMFEQIDWISKPPSINFAETVSNYHFKALSKITLGEFIDLESLFNNNYLLKLPRICAVLYRQNNVNEWGHTTIEPRTYNETERAEQFYEVKITQVYGILQAYLNFKTKFIEGFSNMFEEPDDFVDEEIVDEPITIESVEAERQEKAIAKWNWERIIYKMMQTHHLTFDEVTELKLIFVFNQLSMMKDLKID